MTSITMPDRPFSEIDWLIGV